MLRSCLDGIGVLDFTQIGAGPTATMILSDLGAGVIKVEPAGGDLGRKLGPPWYRDQSPVHVAFNRGKRSIAIDLKSPDGQAVARRLAGRADVVVESFRPGVMDAFGLGYQALAADNPRLVYCGVSGFGQTGPLSQEAGVDGILQAATGLMSLIGDEGSGPCKVQAPVIDVTTGYVGALAVLAAIIDRGRTGRGTFLDISLFATGVALQTSALTSFLGDGEEPRKLGSAAPYSAPNETFPARDGDIMVAAYIGERWRRLCEILSAPQLASDPRFAASSDRVRHRAAMHAELDGLFRSRTCAEWIELLRAADILCSKVARYEDVLANPQLAHLHLIADLHHPGDGRFRTPGSPINAREMNREPFAPPPRVGEHTREILAEADLSESEIERLLQARAVCAA